MQSFRTSFSRAYRFWWLEVFVLSQLLIAHLYIYLHGFDIGGVRAIGQTFLMTGPSLLKQVLAGLVVRLAWGYWKKDGSYLRTIRRAEWILGAIRVVFATILVFHVYGWIKLMLPLYGRRWLDRELWDLDAALLMGHSPNVLLLEALSSPLFLHAIDWLYHNAFLFTLFLSFALFIPYPKPSLRIGFTFGSAVLWITGVWLYVAVPSMGPAYPYAEVWEAYWKVLPHTKFLQKLLLENLQLVYKLREGVIDPNLNFMFGIGAFPSLHVGFQIYVALWIRHLNRTAGAFMMILVAVMFFGSIITGWHYMVDSISGLILGYGAYLLGRLVMKKVESDSPPEPEHEVTPQAAGTSHPAS